jgi:hypothetical protein
MAAISAATVNQISPTINSSKTTTVTMSTNIKTVGNSSQLVCGLTPEQILDGYVRAQYFYKVNHRLPNYVSYGTRKIIIGDFQKILATQGQKIIVGSLVNRPVYITSDNIKNKTVDNARINNIINGLKTLGITAYNMGLGPNTHIKVLQSTQVPKNAVIINIFGGADAGTLNEMGQNWYKNLRGTRKVYTIFWPPSKIITGLDFLERAHDDNYSPVTFTGLAHPDQYLLTNGYKYLYSGDIKNIINNIFYQVYN